MKKINAVVFLTLFIFGLCSSIVQARSGCCSHHGGVCGCGCCDGSSLSSTCAPYYNCGGYDYAPVYRAPQCVSSVGDSGQWTFTENNCAQDIRMTWTEGKNDESFSIGIGKNPGADPGPNVDTGSRTWTFSQVKPGIWYVNIKAGSSLCPWSRPMYWKLEVPKPTSTFRADLDAYDNIIKYSGKCLKSITSYPTIEKGLNTNGGSLVLPFTKKTKITFTATPFYGQAIKQVIDFDPDRPRPTPAPTPVPTPKPKSFWDWFK